MSNSPHKLVERIVDARDLQRGRSLNPVAIWNGLVGDVEKVFQARFILSNLVATQLKIRYHRSVLGFFWTLLNPLLMLSVQGFVFSHLVELKEYSYPVFLFSGFIPWQFLTAGIDTGSRAILNQEDLVRKIAAPKLVFLLSEVLVCLINMVLAEVALFAIFVFLGAKFSWPLLCVFPGTLLLTVFTLGIALIAMSLSTFYRDFLHLIPILLSAWYFATPIMYPVQQLQRMGGPIWLIKYNPATYFIQIFQQAICFGHWPLSQNWLVASGIALASLTMGYLIFKRHEHEYIFRL